MSHKYTFMFAVAMLPAVLLPAQNEAPPRTPAGVTAKALPASDAILATWLHVASTNEVALAQIAVKQGQHADVRAFAQKMIDDHTAFAAKLQPFTVANAAGANEAGRKDNEAGRKDRKETEPAKNPAEASSTRGHEAGAFDHSALIRDLGKKCAQSATAMLTGKTGAEFDRCYMRMQVASHVQGADMVEVFRTYATQNLDPTLAAGQKTIAAHLEHAKTLCKQVDTTVAKASGN